MKTYQIEKDIKLIRELFDLTQNEFAEEIGLSRSNIARYEKGVIFPNKSSLEAIYSFCYKNNFYLNKAKFDLLLDKNDHQTILLHGAKNDIDGEINLNHCKPKSDFGRGFYLGETYEQASSWVCEGSNSSIYCFSFEKANDLNKIEFNVDANWMYVILYYRGAFEGYELNEQLKRLIKQIEEADYIIAPIADNQMYSILTMFSNGAITDEQCLHALIANDLGKQYVLKSRKAIDNLNFIDRFYLCQKEKEDSISHRARRTTEGKNKADLAITEYRRKGLFFDEIFKKK